MLYSRHEIDVICSLLVVVCLMVDLCETCFYATHYSLRLYRLFDSCFGKGFYGSWYDALTSFIIQIRHGTAWWYELGLTGTWPVHPHFILPFLSSLSDKSLRKEKIIMENCHELQGRMNLEKLSMTLVSSWFIHLYSKIPIWQSKT